MSTICSAEGSTLAAKKHRRSRVLTAFGGHAGEMKIPRWGGSAVPAEGRGVTRPEEEGVASRAKRVILIVAARCFHGTRSSR